MRPIRILAVVFSPILAAALLLFLLKKIGFSGSRLVILIVIAATALSAANLVFLIRTLAKK